jgi:hypothetical protein
MNALGQEARALIDSVATHDDPSGSDKTRVRARLAAQLGAAAFATLGATLVSSSTTDAALASASTGVSGAATKVSTGSLLNKLVLSGAALGALVAALWLGAGNERAHAPHAQIAVKSVVPATPSAASAPSGAAREQFAPSAPAASVAVKAASSDDHAATRTRKHGERKSEAVIAAAPETAPSEGTLGLELKLLGEAQAALRAGTPERALVLSAEHRARFPEGVMKEERLGIEALAGCALGRDYRAQAEAFLRVAGNSALRARVQKACGITP